MDGSAVPPDVACDASCSLLKPVVLNGGGGSLVYFEHLRASVPARGSVMLVGCSCCGELRQSAVNGCRMQLKELDGKLGEARIHAHTGTQTFIV